MSADALDFLRLTAFYLLLVGSVGLLDKLRFFGEGSPLDRVLAGPERRKYRDAS